MFKKSVAINHSEEFAIISKAKLIIAPTHSTSKTEEYIPSQNTSIKTQVGISKPVGKPQNEFPKSQNEEANNQYSNYMGGYWPNMYPPHSQEMQNQYQQFYYQPHPMYYMNPMNV